VLPLHPLVVHFPIVLSVLLPISAVWALWAVRKGTTARRAWAVPVAIAVALAVSALVAVKTGEAQDERVERVVAEQPLESHEEAAETFLALSTGLAALVAAGLLSGRAGSVARVLGSVGAVGLVAIAAYVGHSGGKLVYQYGAASAYTDPGVRTTVAGEQVGTAGQRRASQDGDDR